jgi:hypothetical protein
MNPNRPVRPGPNLFSDPAWEAAKAARRNLAHDEAVQESFFLQRQFRSLWSSRMAPSPVDLNEVLRTLTQKKIPFVLTGAHGIGGWTGRPRGTPDVDILVKGGRNHARAITVLKALYPQLEVRNLAEAMAFFIPGERESVLDVAYPHRADLEETLAHPVWTENREHGFRYRVPALETALANKYGAMRTLTRDLGRRMLDTADFGWMVQHSLDEGQQPIDLERLAGLGEKVWPGRGGKEILDMVDLVKAGKPINFDETGRLAKPRRR